MNTPPSDKTGGKKSSPSSVTDDIHKLPPLSSLKPSQLPPSMEAVFNVIADSGEEPTENDPMIIIFWNWPNPFLNLAIAQTAQNFPQGLQSSLMDVQMNLPANAEDLFNRVLVRLEIPAAARLIDGRIICRLTVLDCLDIIIRLCRLESDPFIGLVHGALHGQPLAWIYGAETMNSARLTVEL